MNMTNEQIKQLALAHGFKLKTQPDGAVDLNPYVYDFARALLAQANALPGTDQYFSHDYNGEGFKYHDTLEEAKAAAESSLDWYRDRVADGSHIENYGEFNELCYGIVAGKGAHTIDEVVTEQHHADGEYERYDVGTEIISLYLDENALSMPVCDPLKLLADPAYIAYLDARADEKIKQGASLTSHKIDL